MKPSRIAIVGMAGRFPGARNVHQFWQNLRNGVESIRTLSDADLLAAGVSPETLANPFYVKRAAVLDDVPMFDAAFFGLSPKDAAIMDPQHRHFLESAWEALEDAAYPPQSSKVSIGIFAGSGMNAYLIYNLLANRELLESAGMFQLKQTGNDKDVLTTRVSYQFDLRGPSINVQTACSTSLVAVHMACQSLLNYECDMALAGGVTIEIPHGLGYVYREGEILSRDGHCRSFDAESTGTIFGSGVGVVVLRRLEDAIADRDAIRAVILGSATNNDGARKVGYLAPSVEGQAEVVAEALEFAGVGADDISYVETHGTGTIVGDPIEIRALAQAFNNSTSRRGYCAIGSLKSNVGHLDAAAGVAGLIKTALAMQHAQIPASLHFLNPNPHIDFETSPFYVNARLSDWPSNGSPRRAGVTSLGIGGTNAHVVLEEAPRYDVSPQHKPYHLLTVSAKTETALDRSTENLIAYLQANPALSLADASYTCQIGRHAFSHRRAWVIGDTRDAVTAIAKGDRKHFASDVAAQPVLQVVFMFSGQGSQHIDMARELYEHEEVFRESFDRCAQQLLEPLDLDLRQALYPPETERTAAAEELNQTWLTQPALFAIEYSLAQWWISLGIKPAAMLGHSIGEYVAACIAGVFSLEDALAIAAFRGRLMHGLPTGAMLAVSLPATDLHLNGSLCLAAINNPAQCVASGPLNEIATLQQDLALQSIACRRLVTSRAFHSAMMDPILDAFAQRLSSITLHKPCIPYLSNVSGTWIRPEEANDPAYWTRHLRHTVLFSDCLAELFGKSNRILLEVGPGNVLTSLARQQGGPSARAFPSLPNPHESTGSLHSALHTLGQLWTLGVNVDWAKLYAPDSVRRIPLPTYPFEHQEFWIEGDKTQLVTKPTHVQSIEREGSETGQGVLFYSRVWKPAPLVPAHAGEPVCWLIFSDSLGLGEQTAALLRERMHEVILVEMGSSYRQIDNTQYEITAGSRSDYDSLFADVLSSGLSPRNIVHLWSVLASDASNSLEESIERCFLSPLYLAQALASQAIAGIHIALVSNRAQQVFDEAVSNPASALLHGLAKTIPTELAGITCRSLDADFEGGAASQCAAQLIAEMSFTPPGSAVAFRSGFRFVEAIEQFNLALSPQHHRLARGGVYLITGGFGGIGLFLAGHLAREFNARLVLVGRSALPPEGQWEDSLNDTQTSDAEKALIRSLLAIRSAAGGLLVAHADVTSLAQMQEVIALASERFGKIDGVFHTAGVLDDGPLMLKTAQGTARVLDPKVRGTLVLEEALRNVPLRCFVLFSSVSSIVPTPGQVDYTAANAFLDAFALSRNGRVTVINWGAWRDIGMAARLASPHPMLLVRLRDTPNEIVYASQLSPQHHWLLAEHGLKIAGAVKPLMPGTGYMEMAAAALPSGRGRAAIELRNVFFHIPLMLDAGEAREVRVRLERNQDTAPQSGEFHFSVLSRTDEWTEHCTGIVASSASRPRAQVDRASIASRCSGHAILFDERNRTRQERQLDFGPRWQSLRRLLIGAGECLAEIQLADRFSADASTFHMHPALLDLATGASFYLTEGYESCNDLFLPISYHRMHVHLPLPARLFSHIRSRKSTPHRAEVETFDITIFDEQGLVLAEIEGFSARRIPDPSKTLQEIASVHKPHRSGSERPIEILDPPGIKPIDGARALVRILSVKTPHAIIAVSQPLQQLAAPSPEPSPRAIGTPANTAPPPDQSIEESVADWWKDLLGVAQVGLDDDFFSLGGHSLLGVRLLAKVKRTYRVDLDFAVLFEARTVRRLADAIRKLQWPVVS